MKKKLILFDIDGTLIKSLSTGATTKLILKHFDLDVSNSKVPIDGKTYRRIFVEQLKEFGLEDPERHEKFETALRDASPIEEAVKEGLRFEKIENVEVLIEKLLVQGHTLGLLTGNNYGMSKIKLESAGLWNYFNFGAFGSESLIRGELIAFAMKEAEKETGIKFDKKDVFVIGDTPLDVECAKYGGVKSIAVATGSVSLSELEDGNPDFAFRNFSEVGKILEIINQE